MNIKHLFFRYVNHVLRIAIISIFLSSCTHNNTDLVNVNELRGLQNAFQNIVDESFNLSPNIDLIILSNKLIDSNSRIFFVLFIFYRNPSIHPIIVSLFTEKPTMLLIRDIVNYHFTYRYRKHEKYNTGNIIESNDLSNKFIIKFIQDFIDSDPSIRFPRMNFVEQFDGDFEKILSKFDKISNIIKLYKIDMEDIILDSLTNPFILYMSKL